jgi:hypothetical protein
VAYGFASRRDGIFFDGMKTWSVKVRDAGVMEVARSMLYYNMYGNEGLR